MPAGPANHHDSDFRNPHAWWVAWDQGIRAARRNKIAGLLLWLFGTVLVVSYFQIAAVHQLLEAVGRVKTEFGWKFSAVSTGIFGGLIPALIALRRAGRFTSSDRRRSDKKPNHPRYYVLSNTLFWAAKGVEIDLFYRLQAYWFGSQLDVQTIIVKTSLDQLIYVPAFGLLNVVLFYLWRDCGYSFSQFRRSLGRQWYRNRVLPVLISNWAIWIPAVALIYALPLALQLPVQNLILCFWVLILAFLTGTDQTSEEAGV